MYLGTPEPKYAVFVMKRKQKIILEKSLKRLEEEQKLYLLKPEWFYTKNTVSQKVKNVEATAIDRAFPHLTSPLVNYISKEVSFYIFNTQVDLLCLLMTRQETKKGQQTGHQCYLYTNMYFNQYVTEPHIVCDLCGGQNRNHTITLFLHLMTFIQ